MPTIREVARRAGVSVGTVSHVITGSVHVSEALRLKVQAAIRELNYHPNHVARSLKTSRTRTLGIIVPDMTISFYPQVIRGAEMAARGRGYSLIAVNSDDDGERQKELLSLLRSQRVEGILLVIAAAPTPVTQILRIIESGIPVVCLDRIPDRLPVDSVAVDDIEAAKMGVQHLVDMGCQRVAIVTGPLSLKNERRRLLGCRQALTRAGLGLDPDMIWEGNLRLENVAALCSARLQDAARRPDAILSTNGPSGLGVLRAFRECGLRTPDDIAFVTFDELTVPGLFSPAITTVEQPAYDIGFRAAEILLERIENKTERSGSITLRLPAALRIRESSRWAGGRRAGGPTANRSTATLAQGVL
jgi:DNA-binding LacI/PurR family transcriptional regulator